MEPGCKPRQAEAPTRAEVEHTSRARALRDMPVTVTVPGPSAHRGEQPLTRSLSRVLRVQIEMCAGMPRAARRPTYRDSVNSVNLVFLDLLDLLSSSRLTGSLGSLPG